MILVDSDSRHFTRRPPWGRRIARGIWLAIWVPGGLVVTALLTLGLMIEPHYSQWGAILPLGLAAASWQVRRDSRSMAAASAGASVLTLAGWLDVVLGGPVFIGF